MIPNVWLCGFPIATFDDPGGFFCKGFPANVPCPVPGMFAAQDSKRKLQGVSPMRPSCRRSICHSWIYKLHGEAAESGIHRPVPQESYNSGAVGTDSFICWVSNSGAENSLPLPACIVHYVNTTRTSEDFFRTGSMC